MRILYYAPFGHGGLAEYAHYQANALAQLGVEVTMLCPGHGEGPWHRVESAERAYILRPILHGWQVRKLPALVRKALFVRDLLADALTLAKVARQERFPRVLFSAYNELLAPLWAGPMRNLTREQGTVFGSVVHDPARMHGVGPHWWHRRSMAASYSVLREAFVHAPATLDTARPMPGMRTTVIPFGPYKAPPAKSNRTDWRAEHGIPADARVMLAFGFIRDDKNLDLALRAMALFPNLHLLVAGNEQSGKERGIGYYRSLAQESGVSNRCHWLVRFIRNEEIGDIFNAADLLLLTYSRTFRSASAVLNTGTNYRIPCLVSGGESNLRHVVQKYHMGAWIEPDSLDALITGLKSWLDGSMPQPDWEGYTRDNSWRRNAEIVAEKMDLLDDPPPGTASRYVDQT